MSRWLLDDLDAVAAADPGGELVEWRPAQLVVARRKGEREFLVVDRYLTNDHQEWVVGGECSHAVLELKVAEELFERIPTTPLRSFHRLVRTAPAEWELVHRDELSRRRRVALGEHLAAALELVSKNAPREDITEAFERAHDVDPWNPVSNVLRCGWRARVKEETELAVEDLLQNEPDPSRLARVKAGAFWGTLPHIELRHRLFDEARTALEEWLAPSFVLAQPVEEATQVKAAIFSLLRRKWGFAQPLSLPHEEIVGGLRGEPESLRRISESLSGNREWQVWNELVDLDPSRALEEVFVRFKDAGTSLGRARSEDLMRVTRTWYTLEASLEEGPDRQALWRSILARLGDSNIHEEVPWQRGEALARITRELCGLGQQSVPSMSDLLLRTFGVRVESVQLETGDAFTVSVLPRRVPPCVFLDVFSVSDPLQMRFVAAHALAHLLLMGREARRDEVWCCGGGTDYTNQDELVANAFAAYFLAPKEDMQSKAGYLPRVNSQDFVNLTMQLREWFGLPAEQAGEHALRCLGRGEESSRLPAEVRARLRDAAKTRETNFERYDARPQAESGTRRSRAFVQAIKRCVALGAISEEHARGLIPAVLHRAPVPQALEGARLAPNEPRPLLRDEETRSREALQDLREALLKSPWGGEVMRLVDALEEATLHSPTSVGTLARGLVDEVCRQIVGGGVDGEVPTGRLVMESFRSVALTPSEPVASELTFTEAVRGWQRWLADLTFIVASGAPHGYSDAEGGVVRLVRAVQRFVHLLSVLGDAHPKAALNASGTNPEMETMFDEWLDDNEPFRIGDYRYDASEVLKRVDPGTYRDLYREWLVDFMRSNARSNPSGAFEESEGDDA